MTDIDVFLEHHGVKGMHWGVRNKINLVKKDLKKTGKFIQKHKKVIIISASVSLGAAFALVALRNRGSKPLSTLTNVKQQDRKDFVSWVEKLEINKQRVTDLRLHADKLRLEGKADDIMERRREAQAAYQAYLNRIKNR